MHLNAKGEYQAAAGVAGMVGNLTVQGAISQAREHFKGLPVSAVREADFGTSQDTGLEAHVIKMKLGTVDAFMR